MHQLVKKTADFLLRRTISFVRALEGLHIDFAEDEDGTFIPYIAKGESTWPQRLTIEALNPFLQAMGVRPFLREYQHEVTEASGGLWDGTALRYIADDLAEGKFPVPVKLDGLPYFDQIVVAIDPSGSRRGDEAGIVAAGSFTLPSGKKGVVVLDDLSAMMSPKKWAQESVTLHRRLGANRLLCERNFGGELVEDNIKDYPEAPPVTMVSVSNGKLIRAEPILRRYEQGLVWHAKRMTNLEFQMNSWRPGIGLPSPGALDALVICLSVLFGVADYVHPEKPADASRAIIAGVNLSGGGSGKSTHTGPRSAGGWSKFARK